MTPRPTTPLKSPAPAGGTNPAERLVALPTARMLWSVWIAAAIAAVGWTIAALLARADTVNLLCGAGGGLAAGVGATAGLTAIRPWKPKPLGAWPMVWVGGSGLRLVVSLAAAFLLYSATPLRTVQLWYAVTLAYVVTLVAETRSYASFMRRYGPGGAADAAPSADESHPGSE